MRYKVLKSFCLGGGVDLEIGQEIRVPAPGMNLLRARQKARDGWLEEVPEPAPETNDADDETNDADDETEELEADAHPTGGEATTNAPPAPAKPRGRGRPRGSRGK